MTGAGSADVAFGKQDSILGSVTDTDNDGNANYFEPGRNVQVEDATLDRSLQRLRDAGAIESAESIAGNVEGGFTVSWAMSEDTHDDVLDIIFNNGASGFTTGHTAFSRWFIASEYLDTTTSTSTAERELIGCIPLTYDVRYSQAENTIRETLAMAYAKEERNTSFTPPSADTTSITDGSEVAFHGTALTINSNAYDAKLQDATFTIENISRFMRGADKVADDAVLAAPTLSLETTAIFDRTNQLERVYGSSSATTLDDRMTGVSGDIDFDVGGTRTVQYSFDEMKPANYNWQDLVNSDADLTEQIQWNIDNGSTGLTINT